MRSRPRTFLLLASFAGALLVAGCDSFDPTDMFDLDSVFGTKKRLPGDRKPVFPEGTPGVPQGVPPELVRGNQAQAQPETTQSVPQHAAVEPAAEPKPEPKPKSKPKVAAKPKPADKPAESATAPALPPTAQQTPRPEPPAAKQTEASGAWPSKPQPPMAVQWPEPPTYSDRTRPQ
jgi:outer membrane biosynthesis protein TonB